MFPIKIDEVWIDRFCVRYDWWRRLQPTSSVSPVWFRRRIGLDLTKMAICGGAVSVDTSDNLFYQFTTYDWTINSNWKKFATLIELILIKMGHYILVKARSRFRTLKSRSGCGLIKQGVRDTPSVMFRDQIWSLSFMSLAQTIKRDCQYFYT